MNLTTTYLGLTLDNPLVASAGPLSRTVDGVRQLADAGVGAIVLPSLFEEQVQREADPDARPAGTGAESFAESLSDLTGTSEEACRAAISTWSAGLPPRSASRSSPASTASPPAAGPTTRPPCRRRVPPRSS